MKKGGDFGDERGKEETLSLAERIGLGRCGTSLPGGQLLDTEHAEEYLPRVLADVLEGKLGALGKRMGHLIFKLAVEENLMGNLLAAGMEVDLDTLRKTRVRCVREVKETNGEIDLEDALSYQKGVEL